MIKSLTKKQEEAIPLYLDKWLKIGLNCEPADRNATERLIKDLFRSRDLKPPTKFNWVESPIKKAELYVCYGQHEAGWLSFYDFFINECNLDLGEPIKILIEIAKVAGWWYIISEDEITCVERIESIRFNERKLAHCSSGCFLRYRDGFEIYAWHGVRIPEKWIKNPESIDPLKEQNQELRRCAFEILGWDRALSKIPHEVIQKDDFGTLIRTKQALNDGDTFAQFIRVIDPSTNRNYLLRVPPTIKTAKEGVGATFGLSESEYNPVEQS